MASKDTIGVVNNTKRIIALKGQVPLKDTNRQPKRFCDRLAPGVMTFVPKAYWNIYARNAVVQSMLDEEKLVINKKQVIAEIVEEDLDEDLDGE